MKAVGLGFLAFVGIVALVMLIWGINTSFRYGTADIRGAVDLRDQTVGSGSFRMAAHDRFYNTCASIQAAEGKIKNYQEEIKGGVTSERKELLSSYVLGQKNTRTELIAGYNGDAQKDYTIGQFKPSKLPYHIDPNEEDTKCVVDY